MRRAVVQVIWGYLSVVVFFGVILKYFLSFFFTVSKPTLYLLVAGAVILFFRVLPPLHSDYLLAFRLELRPRLRRLRG